MLKFPIPERFAPAQESAYQNTVQVKLFSQVRSSIVAAVGLSVIFIVLDIIDIDTAPDLWKIRLVFVFGGFALLWYLYAMPEHARRYFERVRVGLAGYAAIGTLILEAGLVQAKAEHGVSVDFVYAELIPSKELVFIFVFAPLATPLLPATVICLVSSILFFVLGWHFGVSAALLVESMFDCLAIIFMGALFSRQYEIFSRREFLQLQRVDEQRLAAERLAQERIRFIRDASHNLSQPVQALLAHNLALEVELNRLGASAQPVMASARALFSSACELGESFQQILTLSRLQDRAAWPGVTDTPIHPILEKLLVQYAPLASTRNIALHVRATPLWGMSDASFLWQVIGNLIDNAVKYTPQGWVLVSARKVGGRIKIHVVDTGIGIADKHREDIFKEFHRLENRLAVNGSGIGLASVRKMLEHLPGHEIRLFSREGKGSHFCVSLPVSGEGSPVESAHDPKPTAGASAGKVVLLVDDNRPVLESLGKALSLQGHEVLKAGSATETRLVLEGHRNTPDIVVTDWQLADGETAEDVVRYVQELVGAIPIIVLSGELRTVDSLTLFGRECLLLKKPIDPNGLAQSINRLTASPA
ncbi:MAG: hypothetical protein KF778_01370 [Rhodocyclaceae bacterium]|nr:hypothetical protein [Rhodocyclaceae bacterium]MBX3667024.1 hypothetical protein [Rhodocyclaceae bacterium]